MIIGIGGVSRSGKSFLANKMRSQLKDSIVLHQDDFVFPEENLPRVHNQIDWEHPSTINFTKLGESIKQVANAHRYVIVEGFLIFYYEALTSLFDYKIFLEIDNHTFVQRKRNDERWGKVSENYQQHIWESYLRFGRKNIDTVDTVIDTRDLQNISFNDLLNKLT